MRISILALALAATLPAFAAQAQTAAPASAGTVPAYLTAAINDPARDADKTDDARRQMAAVMKFTGVKPGATVVELVPGSGYWTRVFSRAVGSSGHVYTIWPKQMSKYYGKNMTKWQHLATTKHYANVSVLEESAQTVKVPTKADIVFTANNYHDYHNFGMSIADFDQSVFAALKPGGVFIIIDHSAPAGSGKADTDTFHRIDPALVKSEVEAAGFVFDGSSKVLRNPDDPLDVSVFDKSIRGHTNQFIYRFRKP